MNSTTSTHAGQPAKAASPAPGDKTVTVLEVRLGRGPKPPFRVVGLTGTDPVEAVRQMSDAIRVGIKDVRAVGEDGYQYGIPMLDGMPTCVRARLLAVTEVACMVSIAME